MLMFNIWTYKKRQSKEFVSNDSNIGEINPLHVEADVDQMNVDNVRCVVSPDDSAAIPTSSVTDGDDFSRKRSVRQLSQLSAFGIGVSHVQH